MKTVLGLKSDEVFIPLRRQGLGEFIISMLKNRIKKKNVLMIVIISIFDFESGVERVGVEFDVKDRGVFVEILKSQSMVKIGEEGLESEGISGRRKFGR